jgi:hypothetical protein
LPQRGPSSSRRTIDATGTWIRRQLGPRADSSSLDIRSLASLPPPRINSLNSLWILADNPFAPYAGARLPELAGRDELVQATRLEIHRQLYGLSHSPSALAWRATQPTDKTLTNSSQRRTGGSTGRRAKAETAASVRSLRPWTKNHSRHPVPPPPVRPRLRRLPRGGTQAVHPSHDARAPGHPRPAHH